MPKSQAEIRYRTIVIESDNDGKYLDSKRIFGKTPFSCWDGATRWLQYKQHALNEPSRFHFGKIKEDVIPLTMSEEMANRRFEIIKNTILPPKAPYKREAVIWKDIKDIVRVEERELAGVS